MIRRNKRLLLFGSIGLTLLIGVSSFLYISSGDTSVEEKNFERQIASTEPQISKKTSQVLHSEIFSARDLRKNLDKTVPTYLCAPDSEIMRCHRVRVKSCSSLVKSALKICHKKLKLKRQVSSLEALRYSEKIGLCLQEKLKSKLRPRKRECRGKKK